MPTFRPLKSALPAVNLPKLIQVRAQDGEPVAIYTASGWQDVERILEQWRIDDKWWREGEQVCRMYWRCVLVGGHAVDVFQDGFSKEWFSQRYAGPGR